MLLERHPRVGWGSHGAADAAFWLEIHDGFRREVSALGAIADRHRSARITPLELGVLSTPRLRGLLARLHGHHQVEDFEYFPALRRADPRLERGFDALERDHGVLREHAAAALAALESLAAAAAEKDALDGARRAAERYGVASGGFGALLARHLADEEDLVVPLLLDRVS